jgi:hypothetical protein
MIKWLIQSTGFTNTTLLETTHVLDELNIKWNDFGVIPKDKLITNLTEIFDDNTPFMIRGGIATLKIISENFNEMNITEDQKQMFENGIDYNIEKFDQEVYSKIPAVNEILLNGESADYYTFDELEYKMFDDDKFIKPSKDLKAFNGGILESGETILNYIYRTGGNVGSSKQENIIISEIKNIKDEYRFFMYKDEILLSSKYMEDNKLNIKNFVPNKIISKAIEYGSIYNPSDFYVMDLCTFNDSDDVKVIEYNCWNASGFYGGNIKYFIKRITEIKKGLM